MISPRLVQRSEWESTLLAAGCKKVAQRQPLQTAEVWETKDGLWFLVPVDNAEGALRSDDLTTVLAQIRRLEDGPHEYDGKKDD